MSPHPTNPTPPPTKDPLPQSRESGGKMPPRKTWLWFLGLLLFNYFLMSALYPGPEARTTVPYTLLKEEVAKGNVKAVYSKGETLTGEFESPGIYPESETDSDSTSSSERANLL